MDACTHEVRLNQWKLIIKQCQNRSEGQTVKQWMVENGVQKKCITTGSGKSAGKFTARCMAGILLFLLRR